MFNNNTKSPGVAWLSVTDMGRYNYCYYFSSFILYPLRIFHLSMQVIDGKRERDTSIESLSSTARRSTLDRMRRRSASRAKNKFTGSWPTPPTGSGNCWRQQGHVTVRVGGDVVSWVQAAAASKCCRRQRRQNVCRQGNSLGCPVNVSPHSGHFVNLSSPTYSNHSLTISESDVTGKITPELNSDRQNYD